MSWTVVGSGTVSRGLLVFSTEIRPPGEYLITVDPFGDQSYGLWGFLQLDAIASPLGGVSRHRTQLIELWRRSHRFVVPTLGASFLGIAFSFYFPIGSAAQGNGFVLRRFVT